MRLWSLFPHPNPHPHFFTLFPNPLILLWDELDTYPPTIGTECETSFSTSYSQWYDLLIMARKGCLNQCSLSRLRLLLQTKGKLLLAQGCGSEDKEMNFNRTLRGTGTRKCFSLSLLLWLSLTPSSLILYSYISLHIFFCSDIRKLHSLFSYTWLPCWTTVCTI